MWFKKKVSFVFVRNNADEVRTFVFSWLFFAGVILFLLAGIAGLIFVFHQGLQPKIGRDQLMTLEKENQDLNRQLVALDQKFDSVQGQLRTLGDKEKALRLVAELPETIQGVQIPDLSPSPAGFFSSPQVKQSIQQERSFSVDSLLGEAEERKTFFATLLTKIHRNQNLFSHIPAIWPCGQQSYISAEFGFRKDPFTGKIKPHEGIDISAQRGTAVYAAADGEVASVGFHRGLGNFVVIHHGSGYETFYGHLSVIYVKENKRIKRKDLIGKVGNTGMSTGPHLHYEVRYRNRPVNPLHYIFPYKTQPRPSVLAKVS